MQKETGDERSYECGRGSESSLMHISEGNTGIRKRGNLGE